MRTIVLGLLAIAPSLLTRTDRPLVDCAFSNPRYAGKCVEQVSPADHESPVQACRAILRCLNDSRCVKNYCNATTVRDGWALESPKETDKKGAGRAMECVFP